MDDQTRDYAVGYGKPPRRDPLPKGPVRQSGRPPPRSKKPGCAIGRRAVAPFRHAESGRLIQNAGRGHLCRAGGRGRGPRSEGQEAAVWCADQAQQANICWPQERLPEVQFDESQAVTQDEVSAEIDRVAAIMNRDTAAPASLPGERPYDAQSADRAPEVAATPHPPRW